MNIPLGDTGVSLGDVADAGKTVSSLTKSLPGMAKSGDAGSAEAPTCPECKQKIVTSQPGSGGGIDGAIDSADQAANCCSKAFDCFGKGLDAVDQVQGMAGEA